MDQNLAVPSMHQIPAARLKVLNALAEMTISMRQRPLRVGIDGIDCAGKTTLGDELANALKSRGHAVIRASIDGFHNPNDVRAKRGRYSPRGYFLDSFDYEALKDSLLLPLGPQGDRRYCTRRFDYRNDEAITPEWKVADRETVLIMDGVFLFRKHLMEFWDFRIFVDITFEECVRRALTRDLQMFGDEQELLRKYRLRYIPGQELYFLSDSPKERANVVIDNNSVAHPSLRVLVPQSVDTADGR